MSGANGTLSGIPVEIATAPANEAYRGVAFAPGTVIGSGGTPPPAPSIHAAQNALPAAINDPTIQALAITVEDSAYQPSELSVKVASSNPTVAPVSAITVTGSGNDRTVSVIPAAVGTSKLTLTVEAPNGVFAATQVTYGASEYLGNSNDRYYEGAGNAGTAVDVGGGYMIVGDDATNILHLYRVQGVDSVNNKTTDFSPTSAAVVVDKKAPFPPSAEASREADYAGGGGWYKDSVEVLFTSNGDRNLSDCSAGSGVNPASIPAPATFNTSGSHIGCGTVQDNVGHVSTAGCAAVQVDATPPSLEITCPASVEEGQEDVTATVTASDAESGLASDPSGTVPIDTSSPGKKTVTRTAIDNVGHETTRSCTTRVIALTPDFGRCLTAPSEKVGKETLYHGLFTTPNCLVKSATQTRPYEWVSGGITTGFKWVFKPETTVTFETTNLVKVKCKGETGTGNITGKKTVGNVVIKFTGCESVEHLCTTPGRAEGELETKSLEGVIGIDRTAFKEGKEIRYAGLDLFPVGKTGVFMEYTCATKPSTTLKGSVIGGVTTDKMFSSGPFTHTQKAGKQKPEGFLGEEKDVLKNNRGGQVGLADNNVQKNEAAIEINAFF